MKILLSKTQKLTATLFLLCCLAVGGLFYWNSLIQKNITEFKQIKISHAEELLKSEPLSEIKKKALVLDEAENFLDERYVNGEDAVGFLQFIESLGKESGVSLNVIFFDFEKETDANNKVLRTSLSAKGTWSQVNKFLLMIENLPYHTLIEGVKLNSFENGKSVNWNLNLIMRNYVI